ncbi:unnamed protein product [Adineta ricciae]|uniref:G-protein coupled receptors family 1 profile domain-containing protein n=1 Tax=Adineta ricciae TaxID=249248 RepID=A0A815LFH8_ADIRI|nr:unnamed protein product [Adineta ricciae]CAF1408620.1 unnamed protein product [Adineta ricciae]
MGSAINHFLLIYLILVAIIGTLGNGVILLAYGNRWNSSKSTSVIFILILACVDLWTCSIVVPTIAIMEYRDFLVPTSICRFYSFSKNLIIISSFIMSFIAFDRFINIALPHCRLLNPRRVKVLLITFIAIGIGLGTLTALAFSTHPYKSVFRVTYYSLLPNESYSPVKYEDIDFEPEQNSSLTANVTDSIITTLDPDGISNITIVDFQHKSTVERCFADTTILSESIREILKSSSNKVFYTLIGIVTIFYTITFVLALRRQNPRIRALKKSLNVLNKFDAYPSPRSAQRPTDSVVSYRPSIVSASAVTTTVVKPIPPLRNEQQLEMSSFAPPDECDEHTLPSPTAGTQTKNSPHQISISDGTSDDLPPSSEKLYGGKQVSFQVENRRSTLQKEGTKHLSLSSVSFDNELDANHNVYYKLPCPCLTTRQLLIKFHFARPSLSSSKWLCCCCTTKKPTSHTHLSSISNHSEDEAAAAIITSTNPTTATSASNSETLRRQLHRHRIQQLRMASTFLIITVSFVLFYLPSILNAERIIKSPIMIYYLYLCTHALNPIIYCFMNPSLRAYVLSMLHCPAKRNLARGRSSFIER